MTKPREEAPLSDEIERSEDETPAEQNRTGGAKPPPPPPPPVDPGEGG